VREKSLAITVESFGPIERAAHAWACASEMNQPGNCGLNPSSGPPCADRQDHGIRGGYA
jgi:hypothetical protein